jgi:hypothetical protein
MPDPDNDTRTLEEKVLDLQDEVEAQRIALSDQNFTVNMLKTIVERLIHDPRYANRLAISAEYERFFGRQVPVREDGGGGK